MLAALFTAVLRSGCFPPEWALGAITPIHKKGDTSDPNNYRGITVGHVLGKLYALVINARLTSWLETRCTPGARPASARATAPWTTASSYGPWLNATVPGE